MPASKDKDKSKDKAAPPAKPAVKDLRVRASEADKVRGGAMKGPEPLR